MDELQKAIEAARLESGFTDAVLNMSEDHRTALGLNSIRDSLIKVGASEPLNFVSDSAGKPVGKSVDVRLDGFIGFYAFEQMREVVSAKDKPKNIVLRLNTPGGSAWTGYAIYQLLRQAANEGASVTTIAAGRVASAGALIFMAGDKRQMPKSMSNILFHRGMALFVSAGFGNVDALGKLDPQKDLGKIVQMLNSIDETVADMLADRSKLTRKKAVEYLKKDQFENPKQALKLGFATEITADVSPSSGGAKESDPPEVPPELITNEPRVSDARDAMFLSYALEVEREM